jgi:hypothetical protein
MIEKSQKYFSPFLGFANMSGFKIPENPSETINGIS